MGSSAQKLVNFRYKTLNHLVETQMYFKYVWFFEKSRFPPIKTNLFQIDPTILILKSS